MYVIEAIVEIPMGTMNKYEIDKEKNRIKLNRVLYTKMTYPAEYGYIENTLADDGDPLDILVLASESTFPGCIVDARVVGYLDMTDCQQKDDKIIAVVNEDPRLDHINSIKDIQHHLLREISHFFSTYKTLQEKIVEVGEFYDREDAIELIKRCQENFQKSKKC